MQKNTHQSNQTSQDWLTTVDANEIAHRNIQQTYLIYILEDISGKYNQDWYFSSYWQEAEKEAEADFKSGRSKSFKNVDDLLDDLKK